MLLILGQQVLPWFPLSTDGSCLVFNGLDFPFTIFYYKGLEIGILTSSEVTRILHAKI